MTTDAGSVDLLITTHGTCDTRECAAKTAIENGLSGEMGGGTYTYLTLPGEASAPLDKCCGSYIHPDQVKAGTVDIKYIDETVKAMFEIEENQAVEFRWKDQSRVAVGLQNSGNRSRERSLGHIANYTEIPFISSCHASINL